MTHSGNHILGERLMSACRYIRENAFLADIGTDHAYLPIFLCRHQHIRGAVAADIAKGPLAIAERHIREEGLDQKIAVCLSDGLSEIQDYAPTDITVFGMGGELIANIIERAPWTKDPSIRLILQPMSKIAELRSFLAQNGYRTVGECLTKDSGRIYQTLAVEYDGITRSHTPLALAFGEQNLAAYTPLLEELLAQSERILQNIIDGKNVGDADTKAEQTLLGAIRNYKKEN